MVIVLFAYKVTEKFYKNISALPSLPATGRLPVTTMHKPPRNQQNQAQNGIRNRFMKSFCLRQKLKRQKLIHDRTLAVSGTGQTACSA